MLRGFRWQLTALVMASILFIISLTSRQMPETPPITATPSPEITAEATPESAPTATESPPSSEPEEIAVRPAQVVTFREGIVGNIQRLNPLLANLNPVERDITALIYEGLTRINIYGEPEPQLAAGWVISSDGLEYVVRLREDVLWHDGLPFTADDVAYTMAVLRSPDFPGADELGTFWRTVETEKLDTYLVRFRLTQPLGSFLDKLTIGILPHHALTGTTAAQLSDHPFNLTPIGTGPYQLETLRSQDNIHITTVDLRVAPVYRERPEGQAGYAVDRMRFQLYNTFDEALTALSDGEIDGLAARNRSERTAIMNATSANDVHTAVEPTLGVIVFNWQKDDTRFFREQRVRLSLETGLDRTSLIERWLRNTAVRADSPLFPGSWAYIPDLEWPPHDPSAARFLLETANIPQVESEDDDSESPYFFAFSILTPDDPALVNMVGEVATQWSQLNLSVSVDAVAPDVYQARLDSGDFDAALVELSLGNSADPDVYAFWHQGQYPDGANYGGVDDRRISEVLELARRDASGINRIIHYGIFQRDFVERAIALPLYHPLYTYATSANFEGIQLGFVGLPEDRFKTIRDWARRAGD